MYYMRATARAGICFVGPNITNKTFTSQMYDLPFSFFQWLDVSVKSPLLDVLQGVLSFLSSSHW